ncbi:hypothetical protein AYI69_g10007, partial [Smittium culicis]
MELIRRISQLEAQRNPVSDHTEAEIYVDSDNYIVEKSPSRDLLLYPELAESLPGISQDLFKSPNTDLERIKFLGICPRNSEMVYDPSSLNEMDLSSGFKKEDSKLHDIHQPVQHKPEAQSNSSEYSGNSRGRPFVQRGRGKKPDTFQGRIGNKDEIDYEEAREVVILNKFRKIELNPITIDSSSGDEDKFTTYELGDTKRKCQGPSKRGRPPDKAQENKLQKLSFFPRESSSYGSGPLSCNHVCPETTSNTRSECIGTFRQQLLNSIYEETRRNAIPKLTKSFGGAMDTLYSNRNKTSTELSTVNTEPSRRAIKAEISNRMVAIQENFQHNREEVWSSRCRHVCDKQELPVRQIRHLETESWVYNDIRIQPCMEDMEAAILLSSMEFNTTKFSKSPQRKISDYSGDTRMEDWNMVPRPHPNVYIEANKDNYHPDNSGSIKRKIGDAEKQGLVFESMENKRSRFKELGLMDSATKLILENPSITNRNKKYGFFQKKFMEWRADNNILDINISAIDIINFLEAGKIKNNWKGSTIFNYRS